MDSPKKISCILPAYNEGSRIGTVLTVLADHPLLDEIIVVDDGSTDNTAEVVRTFPNVTLIVQPQNGGKSYAIGTGIQAARNDLLMFIDSDLVGLSADAVTDLATPVLNGTADVSISLRKNSLSFYRLIGLDFVSGERVVPKSLFADQMTRLICASGGDCLPGFGLEVHMNHLIIKKKLRLAVVWWPKVISPRKWAKTSAWAGTKADLYMIRQILGVISLPEMISQHLKLIALKVRAK